MTRWLPAAVLGTLLGLVALAAVIGLRDSAAPSPAERSDALAAELRCPDCQGLSVADSPSQSAREIRRQVDELVADGATDAEVRAHFVSRYGDWILLAPASPLAWLLPFGVVLAGVGGLAAWLLRHRVPAAPQAGPQPSPEERRRLRDEVEALDA
jgi:cytochrome c-type biogenesis protein CcmH